MSCDRKIGQRISFALYSLTRPIRRLIVRCGQVLLPPDHLTHCLEAKSAELSHALLVVGGLLLRDICKLFHAEIRVLDIKAANI